MSNEINLAMLFAGVAGFILSLGMFVAQWRGRLRNRRDFEGLRNSFEQERGVFSGLFVEMKGKLAALELENSRETPKPGALSRSTRAEALRLLRSGLSSESAASSLGIGKREMRLLERVVHALRPV